MMIEGSGSGSRAGSGSIPLTSGSGSRRPKHMWIRWIRIRNTDLNISVFLIRIQSDPEKKVSALCKLKKNSEAFPQLWFVHLTAIMDAELSDESGYPME
jgi:hypothetical protein